MKCPFCDSQKLKVTDKRASIDNSIRRRRECLRCGKRFTTYERIEETTLSIIKRDGKKEPFIREKLLSGMLKACSKRPVAKCQIEKAVCKIEASLKKYKEIASSKIGEHALRELKKLDDVAYMRFASVYKSFENVASFKKEAEMLKDKEKKK